tara:strand:- start:541 stop:795 length:255 start_codon:yes stop_codon:yes gene_type:complete
LFLPGFSVASVQFKDRGGEEFIVVGTARSLALHPTTHRGGRLRVYRYLKHKLMLVHTTDIEGEFYDCSGFFIFLPILLPYLKLI